MNWNDMRKLEPLMKRVVEAEDRAENAHETYIVARKGRDPNAMDFDEAEDLRDDAESAAEMLRAELNRRFEGAKP